MREKQYSILLVLSTSHALKAEKILKEAGIPCKLIPVPRHISSDCGSCVRVEKNQVERAQTLIKAARVGVEGVIAL